MTTYNGVGAANLAGSIVAFAEEGQQKGRKYIHYDTFVLTADLAANDIINMGGLLPANAKVIGASLEFGALGGSCALQYGNAASAQLNSSGAAVEAASSSGFVGSTVASSAGAADISAVTVATVAQKYHAFTAAVQPQLKCTVASSGATGKTIYAILEYIVD